MKSPPLAKGDLKNREWNEFMVNALIDMISTCRNCPRRNSNRRPPGDREPSALA
jgi:hypothetical protein